MSQRVFVRNLGGTPIVLDVAESTDGVTDGDKGDITVSGGGTGWTIDSDVIREKLTANRTYYVRTNGSDSNDGLADTAGGAFLTIQKAIDVASTVDSDIYLITIQIQNTTHTPSPDLELKSYIGVGPITIQGDASAVPAAGNYLISVTATAVNAKDVRGPWMLKGLELRGATGIFATEKSVVRLRNIRFGTGCVFAIQAASDSLVTTYDGGDYATSITTSSAALDYLVYASNGALVDIPGTGTLTISNAPGWAAGAAGVGGCLHAEAGAGIIFHSWTLSDTSTNQRYGVSMNAWIQTFGATVPGTVAGTSGTGGQFA